MSDAPALPAPTPRPARPFRDAVLPALAAFAGLLTAHALFNDGDTLWQIRTGQWMLAHRAIPQVDPFSLTMAGQPWPPHEWLSEICLALAYNAGSWSGVMALAAACGALAFGLMVWHLGGFLRPLPALGTAVLGFCLILPTMLARPHQIALPCLELWTAALVGARARGLAPPAWLATVMVLWANLHGGYVVGLVLAGGLALEAVWQAEQAARLRVARGWAGFLALSVLAACLTPQGPAGLLFPLQLLGMHSNASIQEWQPPVLGDFGVIEIGVLLALYLGLTGRVRLPPWRVLMVLGVVHGVFAHVRYMQMLGIFAPLLLAPAFAESRPRARAHFSPGGAALAAGIALAALGLRIALPPAEPSRQKEALAAVPPCLAALPGLNDYRFGGSLIFAGLRPYVDSRAELYGDPFLDHYARLSTGDPASLEADLAKWHFAWALLPPGSPLLAALERRAGWTRLYADPKAVVLARLGACAAPPP